MKFSIEIDSDNAACSCREDILSILENVVRKVRLAGTETKHRILDYNGNYVGFYQISADDEEECDEEEDSCAIDDEKYYRARDVMVAGDNDCPVDDEMCDRARDARVEDE